MVILLKEQSIINADFVCVMNNDQVITNKLNALYMYYITFKGIQIRLSRKRDAANAI